MWPKVDWEFQVPAGHKFCKLANKWEVTHVTVFIFNDKKKISSIKFCLVSIHDVTCNYSSSNSAVMYGRMVVCRSIIGILCNMYKMEHTSIKNNYYV